MKESIGRSDIQRETADTEAQSLAHYNSAEDPFQKVAVAENRLEELRKELADIELEYGHMNALRDASKGIGDRVKLADGFQSVNTERTRIEEELSIWEQLLEVAQENAEKLKKKFN